MTDKLQEFRADYSSALFRYLDLPNEEGLQAAYELGRRALNEGLNSLHIAEVHHEQLVSALGKVSNPEGMQALANTGAAFFCESLSTFEMTRRGYFETKRLYERERDIAETLQESLLPQQLPQIPEVEVETVYRPGGSGYQVGGDFYDLFELGPNRWAFLVGDVVGKGPQAAALTGLARHTLRAAALRYDDPTEIVRLLNEAMVRYGSGDFCTLIYGHLHKGEIGARLEITCSGHPMPILLREDGRVEMLPGEGALLGVLDDPGATVTEIDLNPGDSIILYSDGVTEARTPSGLFGEERLITLIESCKGCDAGKIAGTIRDAVADLGNTERRDDIAILVLRVIR